MNDLLKADYSAYTSSEALSPEEEEQRVAEAIGRGSVLVKELADKLGRVPTACVVTFGCQMNARDSEKLCGVLSQLGYALCEDEAADLVIYNTCTVRDNANQRVYGRLGKLKTYKKKNPHMRIGLCGCMVQEPSVIEKLKSSYSFVDLIFGTHNIYKFPELMLRLLSGSERVIDVWKESTSIVEALPRQRKYPFKSGVNISFGCDNFCSFCIVPYVRGREKSRPADEILAEIKALAADGVSEIMLLGQNVNSYGKGLAEKISFPELLKRAEEVEGIRRIRFMTSHPKDLSGELINVMAASDKICRHLHLPVQSGSSRILKEMNRHYSREEYLALVDRIRAAMPDIALTTDIIVGYPSETMEDIEETISLVNEVKYDNAFTFIYSPRTGTPAASMPYVLSEEEIQQGFDKLLKAVQENAKERAARFACREAELLVESLNEHAEGMLSGRMSENMLVHFAGDASLIGQYVKVKLIENKGFYYIGERV